MRICPFPWFLLLVPGFRPHQSLSAWLRSSAPQGHQDDLKALLASRQIPYCKPLGAFPAFPLSFIIWVLSIFLVSVSHLLFLALCLSLLLANWFLSESQPRRMPSWSTFDALSLWPRGVMCLVYHSPYQSHWDGWPLWLSLTTWGCLLGRA